MFTFFGVGLGLGGRDLLAQALLLFAQGGQIALGLAQLPHQAAQFLLAPVRQDVGQLFEFLQHALLLGHRLTNLVPLGLVARLSHAAGDAAALRLMQGVAERLGRQRIFVFQSLLGRTHLLLQLVELPGQVMLPGRQLLEIGLLLRVEIFQFFGDRLAAGLLRSFEQFLLSVPQGIDVASEASIVIPLAELAHHAFERLDHAVLMLAGLRQRISDRVVAFGRWLRASRRLIALGRFGAA